MKYILTHEESSELTQEDASYLVCQSVMASDENVYTDNQLNKVNLQSLLRKVMQEDGNYWDALKFLEEVKRNNANMVYHIKYNDDNKPEGIMWMLPEMREDFVRFGDIICLDAQK